MATVSIIIPVYNTGKYLYKCVDSLVNQTLHDIEIVIVDDGSREDTALICDEIAAKDSRIKVYHKQNEGVSIARNYGLSKVSGDFIGFVDSDDWIEHSMFEKMLSSILQSNVDIVYCDALTSYDTKPAELDTIPVLSQSTILETRNLEPQTACLLAGSVWRGLYKASIIKQNAIEFPQGLKFSEDRIFNLRAMEHTKRIAYLKIPLYYRYMRDDSCVNSYHSEALDIIQKVSAITREQVLKNWNQSYLPVFYDQEYGLFLLSFYGVLKSKKPFFAKYKEIRNMALHPEMQSLFSKIPTHNLTTFLLSHKFIFAYYLLIYTNSFIKSCRK